MHVLSMTKRKERVESAHLNVKIKYLASLVVECLNFLGSWLQCLDLFPNLCKNTTQKSIKIKVKNNEIILCYYQVVSCYFCNYRHVVQ
jgi:hypothetical protein